MMMLQGISYMVLKKMEKRKVIFRRWNMNKL